MKSTRKARKPSVLVSRQFNCTHVLNGGQTFNDSDAQTATSGLTFQKEDNTLQKVVMNGNDATPQSLYEDLDKCCNSPCLDDVCALFDSFYYDDNADISVFSESATVSWIPTVMNELNNKGKNA